ncbi:hypothetical protein [Ktedonobacter racemifer]|uniref:Uncharacterized protein n=1 Tax=Ktedonobacter racemifer DSM 44963 TaxID=485913 RepID=D6TGQ4_KTERA|nr:hypothetical protein [Ktedonobacter racemifer]EFH88833.1 hypothetical protein Krac_10335 [Ktedonobacter racemifer DSM 44963]
MTHHVGTSWSFPGHVPHTGYSLDCAAATRHLNHVLQVHGPLLLPRISPFPIQRIWWTQQGPLASLQVHPEYSAARQKQLTPLEWRSLLLVTGALPQASSRIPHSFGNRATHSFR